MKSTDTKIRVLICYYGEFPWYFPWFLHTCKYNPTIEFLIFSDNQYEQELPENVTITNIAWEEIKKMISRKLGLKVNIEEPYKLCDFRPAYGLIFQEYFKEYAFWGHGDLDVIFGNIQNFISDEKLHKYDVICARHDYLTGWFTLYRNCRKINHLFTHSKGYEKVFTSPKHFCFDETNFMFKEFADGIPYQHIQSEVESMTHVVKKLHERKYISAYFDFHVIEGNPGKLKWKNGTLLFKNKYEVMLYHMKQFKTVCEPAQMKEIPDTFYISPTSIYA